MPNPTKTSSLIVTIEAITEFQQYIPIPDDTDDATHLLLQSVNQLLERLAAKFDSRAPRKRIA
jgi:hypothetical protein